MVVVTPPRRTAVPMAPVPVPGTGYRMKKGWHVLSVEMSRLMSSLNFDPRNADDPAMPPRLVMMVMMMVVMLVVLVMMVLVMMMVVMMVVVVVVVMMMMMMMMVMVIVMVRVERVKKCAHAASGGFVYTITVCMITSDRVGSQVRMCALHHVFMVRFRCLSSSVEHRSHTHAAWIATKPRQN